MENENNLATRYEFTIVRIFDQDRQTGFYWAKLYLESEQNENFICGAEFKTKREAREWATLTNENLINQIKHLVNFKITPESLRDIIESGEI